jgi:hypothetical protein
MSATDRQFEFPQVCKSSWRSSLLYQITGEESYLDWTFRMGDWYLNPQQPDGYWAWERHRSLEPTPGGPSSHFMAVPLRKSTPIAFTPRPAPRG